ncbi:unnamed protein product [Calicophoron daubneyi]|uniref:BTB domain-containing protein n=2 Tax=Calicophoron daubneyi TaxID=300641 RepID=A0AAV2TZ97_CALDB
MMCDMVTLVAEEQSFQILRDVLIRFSSYFSAALESGMSEAQTNRFVFPNLSAQQLRLVTLCAPSNFQVWPAEKTSTHRDSITCFLKVDLLEVLSGAEAADYLQISALSQLCLQRLGEIMSRLFEPESIITHQHHNCGVFSCWLHWWTELNKDCKDPFTNMFFQYTLRYPNLVLQPSSSNSTPDCLDLVIHFLSSDAVRVSDETVILDLIINWINFLLSTTEFCGSDILQSLLNCLRPGLLPSSALDHLFRFWSESVRELKWKNQLSCDELSDLVTNGFKTGPFASLTNRVPPAYQTICCPRASTPCLNINICMHSELASIFKLLRNRASTFPPANG